MNRYSTQPYDGVHRYQYRNLPGNLCATPWFVQGGADNGAGVLEWCFDEQDARERLAIMVTYPEFSNLSINQWK